jgi:hypothetical protein
MITHKALQQCAESLQSSRMRLEALAAFSEILAGHIRRQQNDLQAAQDALAQVTADAGRQPGSPTQQTETWFSPMLK